MANYKGDKEIKETGVVNLIRKNVKKLKVNRVVNDSYIGTRNLSRNFYEILFEKHVRKNDRKFVNKHFLWVVFNNFLLIGARDRSKNSSNHNRIFFDVSLYPLFIFRKHSL